jgi:hypothetical protein
MMIGRGYIQEIGSLTRTRLQIGLPAGRCKDGLRAGLSGPPAGSFGSR